MVSQGTAEILGTMLVDMGVDALENRGVDTTGEVKYVWHYSQASVADQNSWYVAGEEYIKANYPNWQQFLSILFRARFTKICSIGESILEAYADVDLIICNDSTALPGQAQAAQTRAYQKTISHHRFLYSFRHDSISRSWHRRAMGLWDCGIQGALGCYFAAYLAAGGEVVAGDAIEVPGIGECTNRC